MPDQVVFVFECFLSVTITVRVLAVEWSIIEVTKIALFAFLLSGVFRSGTFSSLRRL